MKFFILQLLLLFNFKLLYFVKIEVILLYKLIKFY